MINFTIDGTVDEQSTEGLAKRNSSKTNSASQNNFIHSIYGVGSGFQTIVCSSWRTVKLLNPPLHLSLNGC